VRNTHWRNASSTKVFWYFGRLSWSPDGKLLAFSDRTSVSEPTSIFLLSLDTLAIRRLTSPRLRVTTTRHSPPMRKPWLSTVVRRESPPSTRWQFAGGEEHRLITGPAIRLGVSLDPGRPRHCFREGWLAGKSAWLWKISRHGGDPERLQFGPGGDRAFNFAGNRLAYARQVTISISGGENSTHCRRPLRSGSCLPRLSRVALSFRPTAARSSSSLLAAVLTKSGCAAATDATSFN